MTNNIHTVIESPEKKLITIRHFHSTAQEFASKVWKMQENKECTDEDIIKELKQEYRDNIWHDLYSTLSNKWTESFEEKRETYKQLMWRILTKPLIIQTSPYVRCIESLALLLSDYNKNIGKTLLNTRKELLEFEINNVPVTVRINDMLIERSLWNIFPDIFIPQVETNESNLTQSQKEKLWYYEKVNWWESMVNVMMRCKLMLQELYESPENQLWMSHQLFIWQLINTINKWSYYWYAVQDNRNIANGSISIFQMQEDKLVPTKIIAEMI